MEVKVIIAFANRLMAEGIARLLEEDADIRVVGVLPPNGCDYHHEFEASCADVALVDLLTLCNGLRNTSALTSTLLLLDTGCGEKNIRYAFEKMGVRYAVSPDDSLLTLKAAIRKAAAGSDGGAVIAPVN